MNSDTSTLAIDYRSEIDQQARGVRRFQKASAEASEKGRMSTHGAGAELLAVAVPKLAEAVHAACDQRKSAVGKRSSALPKLRLLPPEVVALIATRTVFDSLSLKRRLASTAMMIGTRVEDECRFRAFKREDKVGHKAAIEKVGTSRDYRYKKRVVAHAMKSNDGVTPWPEWGQKLRARVGAKLIELMLDATGTIKVMKHRRASILVPTDEMVAALSLRDAKLEAGQPWYLPLRTPPVPWTGPDAGGYATMQLPFVKGRGSQVLPEDCPTVYRMVNETQATGWRINEDVAEVLDYVWSTGVNVKNLPSRTAIDKPMRPLDLPPKGTELTGDQKEMLKAWKRANNIAVEKEVRRKSKLLAVAQIRETAREFRGAPAIYFPHQVDWRGRAYAAPLFLQPQGSDVARGLLEFAKAKPLGTDEGARAFVTQGANHWGHDKVSFEDREDWVMEHAERLRGIGNDPLSDFWWAEADDPWQFLAWCLEFAEWEATENSLDFPSRQVISRDGSCNGIQHFAAMLRDLASAEEVNLLPGDSPRDIYGRVAEVVAGKLQYASAHGRQENPAPHPKLAREWLASGLLGRDIVKRQVMTLPYGVTAHGAQTQLMKWLRKRDDELLEAGQPGLPLEDVWGSAMYLTRVILEAIEETVVAAVRAMTWLQDATDALVKADHQVRWVAPTGFPIEQVYRNTKRLMIKTQIMGSLQLRLRQELKSINRRKMAAAIAPNVVHSMDAAHMTMTVCAMPAGTSWAMVHDSFGTHACDAPKMDAALREEFVRMYTEYCPFAAFAEANQAGMPPFVLPEKGEYDINNVLAAEFFFA